MIFLQIQPGASKTQIKGVIQTTPPRLKLSVQAQPLDGAANEAVTEFLSERLSIPRSRIYLMSGQTSKQKSFWIQNANLEFVRKGLEKNAQLSVP